MRSLADDEVFEISLALNSFIHPYTVLNLKCLHNAFGERLKLVDLSTEVEAYLKLMGFFEINSLTETSQPMTASRTYSGLQAFDEIRGTSFDQLTQKFLAEFVRVAGVEGVGQSACSTLISEVLDNVSEHSLAEKCFAMYQLYPKKRFADICIADTGIGIWESYKRHGMFSPNHMQRLWSWL